MAGFGFGFGFSPHGALLNQIKGFTTEWNLTDNTTAGRTVTLPLVNTRAEGALSYNCIVDWGDGVVSTITSYNSANRIHEYSSIGVKTIEIKGICEGWSFNNGGDKLKITKILDFGNPDVFHGFKYLKSGFYGCTNLSQIPANGGFIASGTGIGLDGFNATFRDCTSLASLPVDLFRYNTLVSTNGFNATFQNCTSLASLPVDLFRYNTAVSTSGFQNTFYGCTSLTTLPVDLFRYNTAVSTSGFNSTFRGCTSLASLPEYLFRYNTAVSTNGFYSTFYGCTKLTLNENIFCDSATERTTRFLNRTSHFGNCFYRASFDGSQGIAPDLWNYSFGSVTPTSTGCFGSSGNSITSLSNYNDIPANWK